MGFCSFADVLYKQGNHRACCLEVHINRLLCRVTETRQILFYDICCYCTNPSRICPSPLRVEYLGMSIEVAETDERSKHLVTYQLSTIGWTIAGFSSNCLFKNNRKVFFTSVGSTKKNLTLKVKLLKTAKLLRFKIQYVYCHFKTVERNLFAHPRQKI